MAERRGIVAARPRDADTNASDRAFRGSDPRCLGRGGRQRRASCSCPGLAQPIRPLSADEEA